MKRRRPSRLFTPLEELRFRLRDYGGAALVAVGVCALFGGLFLWMQRSASGPETFEKARVLRFGYQEGRFVHRPLVIVRTSDGRVRELAAPRQSLRHCRKGDMITLVRRGASLLVHPKGCAIGGI